MIFSVKSLCCIAFPSFSTGLHDFMDILYHPVIPSKTQAPGKDLPLAGFHRNQTRSESDIGSK